jgi:SAM-dependent methyltransferase
MKEMANLVRFGLRHLVGEPPRGIGVDLGSGTGLLAATIAHYPQVEAVLAVDVCEDLAPVAQRIAGSLLGSEASKVIPVVGSFDDLHLVDGSVDFIVEYQSLHHADDLPHVFREAARVLKPGSWMLCYDRCNADSMTDETVDRLLSKRYGKAFLAHNGCPPGIRFTRRENAEHEYRWFEWERAFRAAGLELTAKRILGPVIKSKPLLKAILSTLPGPIRRLIFRVDNATPATIAEWFRQRVGALTGNYYAWHEPATAFVLRKPRS